MDVFYMKWEIALLINEFCWKTRNPFYIPITKWHLCITAYWEGQCKHCLKRASLLVVVSCVVFKCYYTVAYSLKQQTANNRKTKGLTPTHWWGRCIKLMHARKIFWHAHLFICTCTRFLARFICIFGLMYMWAVL